MVSLRHHARSRVFRTGPEEGRPTAGTAVSTGRARASEGKRARRARRRFAARRVRRTVSPRGCGRGSTGHRSLLCTHDRPPRVCTMADESLAVRPATGPRRRLGAWRTTRTGAQYTVATARRPSGATDVTNAYAPCPATVYLVRGAARVTKTGGGRYWVRTTATAFRT